MKFNRIFAGTIRKMSIDDFSKYINDDVPSYKKQVLDYLKRHGPCSFTSQPVYDKFSGKEVFAADNAHSDGYYTWYESEIYHFDKYNLKLNDDFIQYVLAKS